MMIGSVFFVSSAFCKEAKEMLSNAPLMSRKSAIVGIFFNLEASNSERIVDIACPVLLPIRKPY
jgi:hypothetical protein